MEVRMVVKVKKSRSVGMRDGVVVEEVQSASAGVGESGAVAAGAPTLTQDCNAGGL